MTSAAAPPSACAARPAISIPGVAAVAQTIEASGVEDEAADERRPPADAVAEGSVDQLAQREAGEEGRQRRLEEAGGGVQVDRDRRQGRQVHVDRQRGDGGQDAQQEQQRRAARAGVDGSGAEAGRDGREGRKTRGCGSGRDDRWHTRPRLVRGLNRRRRHECRGDCHDPQPAARAVRPRSRALLRVGRRRRHRPGSRSAAASATAASTAGRCAIAPRSSASARW